MKIPPFFLKVVGREELRIDPLVPTSYIAGLSCRFLGMGIRGFLVSLAIPNSPRDIFVGRKVRIKCNRRLTLGRKVRLSEGVYIDALSTEGVVLGNQVVIGRSSRIECTGSIRSLGKGLVIGDRSSFGSDCFFGAAGGVVIGKDVIAGQNIRFHSENHVFDARDKLIRDQGVTRDGIVVGDDCWIGAGAVFLDGAKVGTGCVVGAGALVRGEFPDYSVIGGVPARVISVRGGK